MMALCTAHPRLALLPGSFAHHGPSASSACIFFLQEKLVVKMGSARLVSPAWNQSRPWLTGSWLMQYPAEFVAEVGGVTSSSTGALQLPSACDLSGAAPSQQEAALVEDLLGVFLGQAGQHVVHAMVEGPKWQRLALQVKGVTEPSLVEQVSLVTWKKDTCRCAWAWVQVLLPAAGEATHTCVVVSSREQATEVFTRGCIVKVVLVSRTQQ
jgi:hypothetical protein